jgi:hypothetical protein
MVERIKAYGHRNVIGKHRTTIEITKDHEITPRADCIIGVKSDKGIKELSQDFKSRARDEKAQIEVVIRVGDLDETITGRGHPALSFEHETDIVIRKSDFICNRTLMIKADKSSKELNHEIIKRLLDPQTKLTMLISVTN